MSAGCTTAPIADTGSLAMVAAQCAARYHQLMPISCNVLSSIARG